MAAGAQIKDPSFIAQAMRTLVLSGDEFPIKVEGTKTLPYAAVLVEADRDSREITVKLVRPLPPALAEGALFEMVFATLDKRFEGRITFLGRAGYLQYRFQEPRQLLASDRRLWKRYPIRPRENFHVAAQDSEMPGHGITGPLLNLSLGGLAFRVDRMLRLDDGMPVQPRAHLFDRGKTLSLLRVRGLPKGEVLEARGQVVRVEESHSELHLGIQFNSLSESDKLLLTRLLEVRERQSTHGSGGFSAGTGRIEWPSGEPVKGEPEGEGLSVDLAPDEESEPDLGPGPERAGLATLRMLDRRCLPMLLVSPPGEDRARIVQRLEAAGFLRFECVGDLFEAHARCKEAGAGVVRMLMVDLEPSRAEGLEPMGAVRHLEPLLRSFGELPVAFVTRVPDPMLELMGRKGFAALALEEGEGQGWAEILDGLTAVS